MSYELNPRGPKCILKDLFDVYTTDEKQPLYIRKAFENTLEKQECCFVKQTDEEYYGTFKRCNNKSNNYFCEEHKKVSINIENYVVKVYPLPGNVIEEIYKIYTLSNLTACLDYNSECVCGNHFDDLNINYDCVCDSYNYENFAKSSITFYPGSMSVIFKYYNRNDKLIFKGVVYDSFDLDRTLEIVNLIHSTDLVVKLQGWILTNKNIVKAIFFNSLCRDIISYINNLVFYITDREMCWFIMMYASRRKSENDKIKEQINYNIDLFEYLVKNFRNIIIDNDDYKMELGKLIWNNQQLINIEGKIDDRSIKVLKDLDEIIKV